jgi:hypothetical protein
VTDYVRNSFGNAAPAATKPSKVAELRGKLRTPMLAAQSADCSKPASDEVKALVADGAIDRVAKASAVELLPAIDALVAKLKPADSKQASAFVADLDGAYCSALFGDANAKPVKRANDLGRFASLAYSRIQNRIAQ